VQQNETASLRGAAEAFQRLVDQSSCIVAFTGAGISTESGVPDFRSPDSPWLVNKPIHFSEYLASEAARIDAWQRKFRMDDLYAGAKPGRTHRALAKMIEAGQIEAIITQNIDNLHQASGVAPEKIIELHGNGSFAECLTCQRRHELSFVRGVFEKSGCPPICEACGGIVKSATISFGQSIPTEALRRAKEISESCDLFIVLGSSLSVKPAARLPLIAQHNGAKLVIVNREMTPLDIYADLIIHEDIGNFIELLI
jgi:NAD-dependent deacetylase